MRIVKCPRCKQNYEQYNHIHNTVKKVAICEDCKYKKLREYLNNIAITRVSASGWQIPFLR